MAINKVVYGNTTLVDLTEDTATEEDVMEGKTFHDASGQKRTGSATQGGRVQDVEVNGESVVDENGIAEVVVPVSGDVSTTDSFDSYTGGKVKSVQMELSPIQDLHGYSEPWVGGSRKNKLPLVLADIKSNNTQGTWNGNTYTYQGVTITVNTDNDENVIGIETSGTASGNGSFYLCNGLTLDSGYILNGCPSTGGSSTYRIRLRYGSSDYFVDTGSGAEITSPVTSYGSVDIRFNSGTNLSGLTFYPMLRLSTESDPTFESYSNICPISGHTQVVVGDDGKNRFDDNAKTLGAFLTSEGTTSGSSASDVTDYILIKSGNATSFSFKYDSLSSSNTRIVCFYDKNKQFTEYTQYVPTDADKYKKVTFTPTNPDSVYIRITLDKGAKEIQVELGSTATDYEPYQGKDYIINLDGTYYWLRGDVVSGKWSVVDAFYEYDGTESGWSTRTTAGGIRLFERTMTPTPLYNQPTAQMGMCNELTWDISLPTEYSYRIYNGTLTLRVADSVSSLSDFYTWLGNNHLQIEYPIVTPIPLDLTPQQILAIIGENHFSAPLERQEIIEIIARNIAEFNEVIDDENVSEDFTYSSEKIEDRLEDFVDKDAVEEKSATTEFTTINGGLLSSLKVALSPIQDLHGYDSPWVGGAGKNLIPLTVNALKLANAWMTWNGKVATAVGLTITLITDDAENVICIDVDGTASQRLDFSLGWVYTNNEYAISGSTNGSLSTWAVWMRGHGTVESQMSLDGAGYFTDWRQTENECVLTIFNGVTPSHQKFYPMLCLQSAPNPTVFAPYTNISPISGHTQVNVDVSDGQNLFDSSDIITNTRLTNLTGNAYKSANDVVSDAGFFTSALIAVKQGNIVTKNSPNEDVYHRWHVYDANGICVRFTSDNVITIGSGESYVALCGVNSEIDTTQIRQDYQVTVNLGGTYYSGTLDVVTGVFTPDMAGVVFDGSENWTIYPSDTSAFFFVTVATMTSTSWSHILSEVFKDVYKETDARNNDCSIWSRYQQIHIHAPSSIAPSGVTNEGLAEFKAWLSNNPQKVFFELATPQTIQLSPTMVKALVGENHLSAPLEGQEITESKYKQMFDFGDVLEVIGEDYFTLPLQTFTFTNKICNVNDSRVTSNSLVDVYFTSASMSSVEDAGITVESQNGKIVMTAEEQPVGTIQGRIKVVN